MGWDFLPVYGKIDLGSAIQTAEVVIAKIKTNKFDKEDLVDLKKALSEIVEACEEDDE